MSRGDRGRGGSVAATSQGTPRISGSHQKLEEARKDPPFEPSEGVWPCRCLDFWPPAVVCVGSTKTLFVLWHTGLGWRRLPISVNAPGVVEKYKRCLAVPCTGVRVGWWHWGRPGCPLLGHACVARWVWGLAGLYAECYTLSCGTLQRQAGRSRAAASEAEARGDQGCSELGMQERQVLPQREGAQPTQGRGAL